MKQGCQPKDQKCFEDCTIRNENGCHPTCSILLDLLETYNPDGGLKCLHVDNWSDKNQITRQKFDEGKTDLTLLDPIVAEAYCRVRMYGNEKYRKDSWKDIEPNDGYHAYLAAALRHIMAELDDPMGVDEESGLPHLWHSLCSIGFVIWFQRGGER